MYRMLPFGLFIAFTFPTNIRAELIPGFNMQAHVGHSDFILKGHLTPDGQFVVKQSLLGEPDKTKSLTIRNGKQYFKTAQKHIPEDKAIPMIAFLKRTTDTQWDAFWGSAGLVGVYNSQIYGMFEENQFGKWTSWKKHPQKTEKVFLQGLNKEIKLEKQTRALLTLPRNLKSCKRRLNFLEEQENLNPIQLAKFAKVLQSIQREEEQFILKRLKETKKQSMQLSLLSLCRMIPLSGKAFDDVIQWANPKNPQPIQLKAMEALIKLDAYRGSELLSKRLKVDEPMLRDILRTMNGPRSKGWINPEVPKALVSLGEQLRQRHKANGNQVMLNESYQFLATMIHYAHPSFLPILADWTLKKDHSTHAQATYTLKTMLKTQWEFRDEKSWQKWWKKHQMSLSGPYELSKKTGVQQWLENYQASEESARPLMLRLWQYQKDTDLKALFQATTGKHSQTAKQVLAMLWQYKILSKEMKTAIVKQFLSPLLIEQPNPFPKNPGHREFWLIVKKDFPFPREAWVEHRNVIVIGNEKEKMSDSWGACCLADERKYMGTKGGNFPKAEQAYAILELKESKYHTNSIPWRARWKVGPIPLR